MKKSELEKLLNDFRYMSSRRGVGMRSMPEHCISALVEYLLPTYDNHDARKTRKQTHDRRSEDVK